MTKLLCISALHHASVNEPLGRGDKISDDIFLTNDTSVVEAKITRPMFASFGRLEMDVIRRAGLVAYRLIEQAETPTEPAADHELLLFLHELKQLQLALWLVRDNAVYMENAFLQWPHGEAPACITSMNFWGTQCSTADGNRTHTTFTRSDLRHARNVHHAFWKKPSEGAFGGDEPTQPDIARISRALYFIQGAREAPAVSLKVSMYCSAFEALLSTETTELAHKLAERIAWLTAASPGNRLHVFKRVKAAYAIRSKAVHGSTLKKGKLDEELLTAARECDEIARTLFGVIGKNKRLNALLREPSMKAENLEDILLHITLDSAGGTD